MENTPNHIIHAIKLAIKDAVRQAATQMVDDMGIDRIINELEGYPSTIKAQQHVLAAAQQNMDDAKLNVEMVKADIMVDINAAVGENGKPLYSNEKAREVEFVRQSSANQEYIEARNDYRAAEDRLNDAKYSLDQLYNEFTVHKSVLSALTAKMNLLAGANGKN